MSRPGSRPASSGSTATNLFDAAAGFGGFKESGFGREGGREGLEEYLKPPVASDARPLDGRCRRPLGPAGAARPRRTARHRPHRQALHRRQAGPAGRRPQHDGARPGRVAAGPGGPRQPQGHPQRRRGRRQGDGLERRDGAQPRPGALLRRREPLGARRRVRATADPHDGRLGGGGRARGGGVRPPDLLLRRLGRQVRRPRPGDALPPRHAGDERALRRRWASSAPTRRRCWPSCRC